MGRLTRMLALTVLGGLLILLLVQPFAVRKTAPVVPKANALRGHEEYVSSAQRIGEEAFLTLPKAVKQLTFRARQAAHAEEEQEKQGLEVAEEQVVEEKEEVPEATQLEEEPKEQEVGTFTGVEEGEEEEGKMHQMTENPYERQAYVTLLDMEALDNILDISKQLNTSSTRNKLLVIAEDLKLVEGEVKDRLKSAGNIELIDIAYVYDSIFLRVGGVPEKMQELKRPIFSYSNFRDFFTNNRRLLMWLLWEYEQLVYVDPDTIVRRSVDELFQYCGNATLCAPGLYPRRCVSGGPGGALEEEVDDQDLFNPRLMVLSPKADTARRILDVRNESQASDYSELYHELNTLMIALKDLWKPVPPCFSGIASASRNSTNTSTVKAFPKRILMIQGGYGEKAKDSLSITSEVNKLYCERHGIEYKSFEERVLNETKFTGHWDRYEVMRRELRDFDYVMWIDADAMVKEFDFDVRDAISTVGENIDIMINSDWEHAPSARSSPPVNTGVMIWKKSNWTMDFLDHFLSLENAYCRKCAETRCERIAFHDQGCLEDYLMTNALDVRAHMQIFPVGVLQRKINDNHKIDARLMSKWNTDYEFIVHAAGIVKERHEVLENQAVAIINSF